MASGKVMESSGRRSGERGIAIIFYAAMLFFSIAVVGLAVDVGTLFMIKARLSSAVDAAALAAGRSINVAQTIQNAQTQAASTADSFFTANFPNNYFNTIGTPTVTPTLTEENDANGNPNGVLDVKVTASVTAPTYFMNVFNVPSITVAATGTASRRVLLLMMVLDISSSMNNSSTPTACENMKTAAENFLTLLNPYDQVGLITFETTVHLLDTPTTDHTQISSDVSSITCKNNTNTISALDVAYQQIKTANLPLALNTIMLFTDGSPNAITANFPARATSSKESRWSPPNTPPAPPTQTGSTFKLEPSPGTSIANSCGFDTGPTDPVTNTNTENICVNEPVLCTDSSATMTGSLSQWAYENYYGGDTNGLLPPTDSASARTINGYNTSTVSYPSSCGSYLNYSSLPNGTLYIRQYIAYIPNTDIYGNSLVNGVPATGSSTYGTVTGGYDTRKNWIYKVNNECNGSLCAYTGGPWSSFSTYGSGSNFFPSTNSQYSYANVYSGYLRPDQPNSIVAASMNGAMAEAFTIRADNTYNPVIYTVYLTGNGSEAVDREFLAIVANVPNITALPYDSNYATPPNDPVMYANPAYRTDQATGLYLVTADSTALTGLFGQLASEVLRLSQ